MRLLRGLVRALPWCALVFFTACTSRQSAPLAEPDGARLVAVEHGRLIDVYGLRPGTSDAVAVHARDVLAGYELPAGGPYEELPPHPDSLQPRVLITHVPGTRSFGDALAALRAGVRRLDLGAPAAQRVVARDAALELRFARPLDPAGVAAQLRALDGDGERALPARLVVRGDRLLVDPVLLGGEA